MEKNNKEKKETAMKTVGGRKRKLIITNHDDADNKRSWPDLLHDILESIKKRLFFRDQVNFRLVCKSWSCVERVASLQQIPWIFVFDNVESYLNSNEKRKEKYMVDSCKLVDSKNKKTYTIDANVIKDKLKIRSFDHLRVHESKNGWLLCSQSIHQNQIILFLYSPFFSEGYNLIELPVLMDYNIYCATFTSNPLEEDCKILTIGMKYRSNNVTIIMNTYGCGQGSGMSSRKIERKFMPLYGRNLMYSEGSLYYETGYETMVKLDLALEEWTVLPRLPSIRRDIPYYKVKSSNGELFLITECNLNERRKCWHYNSRIYRLNLSSMSWEDLDSIGDRVLFFGEGYNSILNSSVLKSNGEQKDISDKIYYCKTDVLKYCSVHEFTLKYLGENEKLPRKRNCLRHYGSIATKRCRKMWIDPPPL